MTTMMIGVMMLTMWQQQQQRAARAVAALQQEGEAMGTMIGATGSRSTTWYSSGAYYVHTMCMCGL